MIDFDRPVVFFDLETTGVSPMEDRIIDIALLRRDPGGSEEAFSSLVNPGMPIPPESTAIHHITDEMVQGQPSFKDLAPRILRFVGEADFGGFGISRFDIPMLAAEFKRAGCVFSLDGRRVVDALQIYHKMEPRNLSAAYRFYCGKPLEGAHRAKADAEAAREVFFAQLQRYTELPRDMEGLGAFCSQRDPRNVDSEGKFVWRNGEACFNFGKHRTLSLQEIARRDPSYLKWLMGTEKATAEMARICRDALEGRFPVKK